MVLRARRPIPQSHESPRLACLCYGTRPRGSACPRHPRWHPGLSGKTMPAIDLWDNKPLRAQCLPHRRLRYRNQPRTLGAISGTQSLSILVRTSTSNIALCRSPLKTRSTVLSEYRDTYCVLFACYERKLGVWIFSSTTPSAPPKPRCAIYSYLQFSRKVLLEKAKPSHDQRCCSNCP
ncbi:hypothetical protein CONPUDRAFT_140128 [Coniophora puteana RWD-64-598 SS2]|uniref:Uncharacterized protein n=1 Tax=Coniophora puteana (strain RWD-64-598) TaxID=741705 RepID=A0A5M3M8D4_CONPW|nr:uncharacterized protein CONPUDRAFT_140128 [Coniophora puteana RWD-64-598 SS2]EIW75134.1 hypothetical protein CONPUDRAFT_140128 [Coniophora puteana RWD-64-598 SS2]